MEKKRVLIFPAGTEIAFEIQNALKYSKFVELYGANSIPSHAEYVFLRCFNSLPFENDPSFIFMLNAVIDEWGIEYVYPAHDSACVTLTKNQDQIHAKIVSSPIETVEICRSKNKTYEYFKDKSFIPTFYHNVNEIEKYPVFVKPAVGQGSVGAVVVNNANELNDIMATGKEYAICEYLPGNEYTIDCFTDRHRALRSCHMRQRERIKTGISVRSSLISTDKKIKDMAEAINSRLVFNGAWFFQVKIDVNGEYKLMEISPRIPGTMGVSRNLGINYPMLTLFNMWGYDVEIIDNNLDITLDRAFISRYKTSVTYDIVYVDFDDTMYLGDCVNTQVILFLYQCFNKHIPIVLLTKHNKDILLSLKKYKISADLFSEIVHIGQDQDKSSFIGNKKAILIDDSFAERKNVKEKCGIPVYDLDMVESLIDWRM